MKIVRCISCDGYGWETDEHGETQDCAWCGGTGYTYRDEHEIDHRIPEGDYSKVAATLEKLDAERLREMGYSGEAKHPDEQAIRKRDED